MGYWEIPHTCRHAEQTSSERKEGIQYVCSVTCTVYSIQIVYIQIVYIGAVYMYCLCVSILVHVLQMVTIIDPHIKRDGNYFIHKVHTHSFLPPSFLPPTPPLLPPFSPLSFDQEAENNGYYVKKSDNTSVYEGWCWPGKYTTYHMTNNVHHVTIM